MTEKEWFWRMDWCLAEGLAPANGKSWKASKTAYDIIYSKPMKRFDYISILAGGKCKFNCDFCIGKDIRTSEQPHISTKWKAFLECFADSTDLLSVSGDTSDPSFLKEVWSIPTIAKSLNSGLKATLHTRNINVFGKFLESSYDKFIFSIDENISKETVSILEKHKHKVRLSFVITTSNFWIIKDWSNDMKEIFDFQMTIRPEVHEVQDFNHLFFETFLNIRTRKSISNYQAEIYTTKMKNGAIKLRKYPNIWYWDYNKTNEELNTRYLFSDGTIASNCQWDKIIQNVV